MGNSAEDAERFKERVREDWTGGVAAWKKWNPQFLVQTREATRSLLRAAAVQPGMHVLDLATGTGDPALSLAGGRTAR